MSKHPQPPTGESPRSSSNSAAADGLPALRPALGFWAVAIYGIGDILGAGIYALVGEVAGAAGTWSPLSFCLAMMVAGLTGVTYAELVARFPHSGGEATFCLRAFGRPHWAFLVGWLVFCSGVVSMATVTHAFGNSMQELRPGTSEWPIWVLFLFVVSLINFWGIRQSSTVNILLTLVEFSGLLLVLTAGLLYLVREGQPADVAAQEVITSPRGVLSGAVLAFFAYIGFEDMNKVVEEVRSPETVFPRAIVTAILVCGVLYLAVCWVALSVLPVADLSTANAPLVAVVRRAAPAVPSPLFTVIALMAVANTGLLNGIMASRLVYGMSRQGLLPAWLGAVHRQTQTPHYAVLGVLVACFVLVFSGTLGRLAETTSLLLLIVFAAVHLSAIRLRRQVPARPGLFRVPLVIPVVGLLTCLTLTTFVSREAWITGGGVALLGLALMLTPTGVREVPENS